MTEDKKNEIINGYLQRFSRFVSRLDYFEYEGEDEDIISNFGNKDNDFFEYFSEEVEIPKDELQILYDYYNGTDREKRKEKFIEEIKKD